MADDNANSAPVATEQSSETTSRPEYIQEKFWNAEKGEVNIENLASSYNSLEKLSAKIASQRIPAGVI